MIQEFASDRHPVKRELAALLLAVGVGSALLLTLYSAQLYYSTRTERMVRGFHEEAVALARRLLRSYFVANLPQGIDHTAPPKLSDPVAFSAQAELAYNEVMADSAMLLDLYAQHPESPFETMRARLTRAIDEMRALRAKHPGDPEGFARDFSTAPLYIEIVAEQIERMHEARGRRLVSVQSQTVLLSWVAFLLVLAVLSALVYLRARSNLRAIDVILREERVALERFRQLAENMRDVFWIASADLRKIEYVSPAFAAVWDRSPAELLSNPGLWLETVAPEYRAGFAAARQALTAGEALDIEYQILCPDGTWRWIHDRGYPVRESSGGVVRAVGVAEDISARKEGRARMVAALAEKEVLLREVYHRVKNNMQVVASLLSLQGRAAGPGEARRMLSESAERVKSMAMVHEQLYRSHDLGRVAFSKYVAALLDHLAHIYSAPARRISLRAEIAPLEIGVDYAVPLSLIVHELVSNACKHAFAADRAGAILVTLTRVEPGELELTVKDDGKGLPDGWTPEKATGLGIQLITALSRQLAGTLIIGTDGGIGARFSVRFPEPGSAR